MVQLEELLGDEGEQESAIDPQKSGLCSGGVQTTGGERPVRDDKQRVENHEGCTRDLQAEVGMRVLAGANRKIGRLHQPRSHKSATVNCLV